MLVFDGRIGTEKHQTIYRISTTRSRSEPFAAPCMMHGASSDKVAVAAKSAHYLINPRSCSAGVSIGGEGSLLSFMEVASFPRARSHHSYITVRSSNFWRGQV
ncbi:hypothetical protein Cob_v004863 [Colletotrichum orbiculare MAFF 240422]|uniref:Uncharacterized protein n=1 Tax=Colletotrichum orbiculare (strain 104-T / ATCC 96160 / CBS 514.97 / LARS 414 / MAFF 240422) TaxID=1213857 RepID=A0A484FVD9_COLOR|nr:hypothetical protein Cob_v004863 [Colletotrichum orbiculare MAFF 240422]